MRITTACERLMELAPAGGAGAIAMGQATTALLRRIEAERESKRQEAWAVRKAGKPYDRKNPKWAVDHLLHVGAISADQHEAARRYASAIERSQPGGRGQDGAKVDGGRGDPHAAMWDAAVSAQVARGARSFVAGHVGGPKRRLFVLDRLFAFDGDVVTGSRPTMTAMTRSPSGAKYPYDYAVRRVRHVLELLEAYFEVMDRGYGPKIGARVS